MENHNNESDEVSCGPSLIGRPSLNVYTSTFVVII